MVVLDLLAQPVRPDQPEHRDCRGKLVRLAQLDRRVPRALLDHRVTRDNRDNLDLPVQLAR